MTGVSRCRAFKPFFLDYQLVAVLLMLRGDGMLGAQQHMSQGLRPFYTVAELCKSPRNAYVVFAIVEGGHVE